MLSLLCDLSKTKTENYKILQSPMTSEVRLMKKFQDADKKRVGPCKELYTNKSPK